MSGRLNAEAQERQPGFRQDRDPDQKSRCHDDVVGDVRDQVAQHDTDAACPHHLGRADERQFAQGQRHPAHQPGHRGPQKRAQDKRQPQPGHARFAQGIPKEGRQRDRRYGQDQVDQPHDAGIDVAAEIGRNHAENGADQAGNQGHCARDRQGLLHAPHDQRQHVPAKRIGAKGMGKGRRLRKIGGDFGIAVGPDQGPEHCHDDQRHQHHEADHCHLVGLEPAQGGAHARGLEFCISGCHNAPSDQSAHRRCRPTG